MFRARFSFLLLTAAGGAAWAQPPAPYRWQVDWGRYYCSLVRPPGEGRRFSTVMFVIPGGDGTQIMLVPEGGPVPSGRISSLLIMPQQTAFDVNWRTEQRGGRTVVVLYGPPYGFSEALVGATELQLRRGDEILFRISLPDARAAVAEHRRCTAEVAREWGIDEAALAALSQRPATTNRLGLDSRDYPPAALRMAIEGRVLVRIAVSAQGRATDCAPVATSGSPVIDATTCRVALMRARFRPARDAEGRAVAARAVFAVNWLASY
jgi:TonB family protein